MPGLRAVADPDYGTGNFQSFWVEVGPEYPLDRDGLLMALAAPGSPRVGASWPHTGSRPTGTCPHTLPVTEHLTDTTLILPLYHQLDEASQDRVIDVLLGAS